MCNFLSAILLESGELVCDPEHTDSHEHLLHAHHIRDGHAQRGRFVRLEFTPPEDTAQISDLSTWQLQVDEDEIPAWYDAVAVRKQLESRVQRMLVGDERDLLLGGCWVLHSGARVNEIIGACIPILAGSIVQRVYNSGTTIQKVHAGGIVQMVRTGGIVQEVCAGGIVHEVRAGGIVQRVCDSGIVQRVYTGGIVHEVWAGGIVHEVCAGGTVQWVYNGGTVQRVHTRGNVQLVRVGGKVVHETQTKATDCV